MPAALVIIQKSYQGDDWENTHCVGIGPDYTGEPSDVFLSTIGCGSTLDATTTGGTAPTNFLQRLLRFERGMHKTAVTITKVYVTDGKRNRLGNTEYFTQILSLACLDTAPTPPDEIAPGSITVMVNRNPAGYSHRPGRMFFRGMLRESDITFGGPKLVTWQNSTQQAAFSTTLAAVVGSGGSNLASHFNGGTNVAGGVYCIPHYKRTVPTPAKPNDEGSLIDAYPVASLSNGGVAARQAKRGRRRS